MLEELTFGNALACAAMIVMSPSCGFGLMSGVYCLMARWSTSFSCVASARGKLRMCDASILCSSIRKCCEDIVAPVEISA